MKLFNNYDKIEKIVMDYIEYNTPFSINDFNDAQLMQLLICVIQGIDIGNITNPRITYEEMFDYRIMKVLEKINEKYQYFYINDELVDDIKRNTLKIIYIE